MEVKGVNLNAGVYLPRQRRKALVNAQMCPPPIFQCQKQAFTLQQVAETGAL
jgi:hypothetical protein